MISKHDETVSVDGSRKYRLELADGAVVEAVYLQRGEGEYGLCLSTQAGCNMGCIFCATASQRLLRNLTAEEIVDEANLVISSSDPKRSVRFITLAGMGEPLLNYNAAITALDRLSDLYNPAVISISTIGFSKIIRRMATEQKDIRLYLSLHATDDDARRALIPGISLEPIADLLAACEAYAEGRSFGSMQISYLLLPGVNDGDDNLNALIKLVKVRNIPVQILAWNEVPWLTFKRVEIETAEKWVHELIQSGTFAYFMPSQGQDIGAACGQLASARRSA